VLGAASVELLVTGQDDVLPARPLQFSAGYVFCFRLSSHAGKTTVGVHLDVGVVWVSVFPDVFHFIASGSDAVHALFPFVDVTLFELNRIPLAADIDVSS